MEAIFSSLISPTALESQSTPLLHVSFRLTSPYIGTDKNQIPTMSEYWKSTPKYWCKHCKTFVKDTKFEKTNHEATPKHQGNLKRFLRDLHKGHEREERDKQRAKDEVSRLNGIVAGSGSKAEGNPWERRPAVPAPSVLNATPADRKKQLAQLADLGVAVPEDFRKEMAMAGDWQTTSERVIYERTKKEEGDRDVKPEALNIGVRKRKFEGQEEEEEAGEAVVRRGWGAQVRAYPGTSSEDDLDALLNITQGLRQESSAFKATGSAVSPSGAGNSDAQALKKSETLTDIPLLKREESLNDGIPNTVPDQHDVNESAYVKQEDGAGEGGVVFKKRKAKPLRQR